MEFENDGSNHVFWEHGDQARQYCLGISITFMSFYISLKCCIVLYIDNIGIINIKLRSYSMLKINMQHKNQDVLNFWIISVDYRG